MANKLEVKMKVVDQTTTTLDKIQGKFTRFTNSIQKNLGSLFAGYLGYQGIRQLTRFGTESVKMFMAQEQAERRLASAMQERGIYSQEALDHAKQFALEIQNTTTVEDDQVISLQRVLVQFGFYGKAVDDVTKASIDLAKSLNMDTEAAAMLVAKSVTGTNMLSRYGLSASGAAGSSERLASVLSSINEKFGGAAQAEANTYAGRIEQLKNRYGDLREEIGRYLVPIFEKLAKVANSALSSVLSTEDPINILLQKRIASAQKNLADAQAKLEKSQTKTGKGERSLFEKWFIGSPEDAKKSIAAWTAELEKAQNLLSERMKKSKPLSEIKPGGVTPSKTTQKEKQSEDEKALERFRLKAMVVYPELGKELVSQWEKYQEDITAKQKKAEDDRIRMMEREAESMAILAMNLGAAIGGGIGKGAEGVRDILKGTLNVMLDFIVQQQLAAAAATLAKTSFTLNPAAWGMALAKIGAMSAAVQVAKAGIQSFEDGGFPQGRNAMVQMNEKGQESVLNARATAVLGRDAINALNKGQAQGVGATQQFFIVSGGDIARDLDRAIRNRTVDSRLIGKLTRGR